jgi:hypothetical protein
MEQRGLVVVEANEVPLRVVEDLAPSGRIPFLARLLDDGTLIETEVDEVMPRDLYPSQTWASLNTGVPWAQHGIYWYGDHKPADYPLYWQIAARSGRSVGLVNTLHSSPLAVQCAEGDFRFVIPDCFAIDEATLPRRYQAFQRANLSLTAANSRRVGLRPETSDLFRLALSLPRLGVRLRTVTELGRLLTGTRRGRIPRERIRSGQFMILRDLFLRLLRRNRPDLAVVFTNHVAAAMHRYWYALYPEDFGREHYDPEWVERYRDEIPVALELLDRFLVDLERWCRANDRTLAIVSSMGQGPSSRLDTDDDHEAVVVDGGRFLEALGVTSGVRISGSMNPQLTVVADDEHRAVEVAERLVEVGEGDVFWVVDRAGDVVTLTYHLEVVDGSTIRLDGQRRSARSVGVEVHAIDDHSSGRHIARGILGVANSPSFKAPIHDVVSHLDFAPAVLDHLGLERAAHHRSPDFRI